MGDKPIFNKEYCGMLNGEILFGYSIYYNEYVYEKWTWDRINQNWIEDKNWHNWFMVYK
jgi:hypothetical protein